MKDGDGDRLREDCGRALGHDPLGRLSTLRAATVLVTGGTGFVGTWLAQTVACLNDAFEFKMRLILMATHPEVLHQTAPHLARRVDIRLLEQDVRNLSEIPGEVQFIVHAAGTPDSRFHASNPIRTLETYGMGSHAVYAAASRLPELRKILHLSSGLVYGHQGQEGGAIHERMFSGFNPSVPGAVYAEAHRAAEAISAAFRSQSGLPVTLARLFTFLGPFQLLDRPWAVNNFMRDALRGGPIRVQGDGETVRSFMYGADLAAWLLGLLAAGRNGVAYNVGSPEGIQLKELAHKIAGLVSPRPVVELNTLPQAHIPRTAWVPDVTLIRNELQVTLTHDLDGALQRTLEWNRRLIGNRFHEHAT